MRPILRALIVEADHEYRQALLAWLNSSDDVLIAGITDDELEGVVLACEREPDVVLLDQNLVPDLATEPPQALRHRYADRPILLMSCRAQELLALDALRHGVAGCIIKEDVSRETLLEAIHRLWRGEAVLTSRLAGLILDQIAGPFPQA